jgi:hypothetical protein
MGRKTPSVVRVLMAKRVATSWLDRHASPEYRLTVYAGGENVKNLPSLLRAFRDSKLRLGSVDPVADLGIDSGFDQVTVWSSSRKGMLELDAWFRSKGCETTGIW